LSTDAAVWSHSDSTLPLVLVLHGYGSNERDLAGLFAALPAEYQYVSLRAPMPLDSGWAWFPITAMGAELAASGGRASARAVSEWVNDQGLSPVGAIGFSQGGALALELMREHAIPTLDWAAVLSGFVLEPDAEGGEVDERDHSLAERAPHVFWGRGTADPVISPSLIARTLAWIPAHTTARIEIYPGLSHSVSAEEIDDLSRWMRERLS
ncbi:MAG: alpha/beta hydrolase, partial [Agromyces sp.]